MALGGLRKNNNKVVATEVVAGDADKQMDIEDDINKFIDAAPLHTRSNMPKMKTVVKRKARAKNHIFSLTTEVSEEIDTLKLMATGFQPSRSDVVKAAIAYLARQDKSTVVAELQAIAKPNK
jgi:hypothetical protein